MNDLINRRVAIKAIADLENCYNGYSDTYDKSYIIGVLEEQPTVDAVPVIRCKDCKHWQCDDSESYCDELGIFDTDMNSYCSYGKRKDNG